MNVVCSNNNLTFLTSNQIDGILQKTHESDLVLFRKGFTAVLLQVYGDETKFATGIVINRHETMFLSLLKRFKQLCQKVYHSVPRTPVHVTTLHKFTRKTTYETNDNSPSSSSCVFGNAKLIDAEIPKNSSMPLKTDHVLVQLTIRSTETNEDNVSRNFAHYDCSVNIQISAHKSFLFMNKVSLSLLYLL